MTSGLYRHRSTRDARSGGGGVAFGFAPAPRLVLWNSVDALATEGPFGGRSWVAVNETSFEAHRGIWLKVSPQFQSEGRTGRGDLARLVVGTTLLPRTHWNVNLSYCERNRRFDLTTAMILAQLHLYPSCTCISEPAPTAAHRLMAAALQAHQRERLSMSAGLTSTWVTPPDADVGVHQA